MPTISVIMPAYNAVEYIDSAIASIIYQSYADYELIIINDGSTDGTFDVITRWAAIDRRIIPLSQDNLGIVKTLNRALAIARGKYIARMDADDLCAPRRFEKQLAAFLKNPQLIACGTWLQKIDGSGKKLLTISNPPVKDKGCKERLLLQSCFAHPSIMLRRDRIPAAKLVYKEDYLYAEDYKLWSDIAEFGEFCNIPERLLQYRIHRHQIGSRKVEAQRSVHSLISYENLRSRGVAIDKERLHCMLWPSRRCLTLSHLSSLIGFIVDNRVWVRYSPGAQIAAINIKAVIRWLLFRNGL